MSGSKIDGPAIFIPCQECKTSNHFLFSDPILNPQKCTQCGARLQPHQEAFTTGLVCSGYKWSESVVDSIYPPGATCVIQASHESALVHTKSKITGNDAYVATVGSAKELYADKQTVEQAWESFWLEQKELFKKEPWLAEMDGSPDNFPACLYVLKSVEFDPTALVGGHEYCSWIFGKHRDEILDVVKKGEILCSKEFVVSGVLTTEEAKLLADKYGLRYQEVEWPNTKR
jgi:hypothetical protein